MKHVWVLMYGQWEDDDFELFASEENAQERYNELYNQNNHLPGFWITLNKETIN